jgi:hypothetical protein
MGIGEADAGGRDSIKIGRPGGGFGIEAREIPKAEIVGDHDHDVRWG